jgi:hypothetical protein
MCSQVMYRLERVPARFKAKPELGSSFSRSTNNPMRFEAWKRCLR